MGDSRPTTIVVGAGMASIACCARLRQLGWTDDSLSVLEAGSAMGGRIRTDRGGVDLGGAWVHGTAGSPLAQLATEFGVDLLPVCDTNPWMNPGNCGCAVYVAGSSGVQVTREEWDDAVELHLALMNRIRQKALEIPEDDVYSSLEDAFISVLKEEPFQSAGDNQISCLRIMQHMIECWMGGSSSELQLLEFSGDPEDGFGDYSGSHCLPQGGMQQLVQGLMNKSTLESCIQFDTRVTGIDYSSLADGKIFVKTEKGDILTAEVVVLTVPISALGGGGDRSDGSFVIDFNPPLPSTKREALQRMRMAAYKKVRVLYDSPFWPHDPFLIIERSDGLVLFFNNLHVTHNIPALEACLVGSQGWKLASASKEVLSSFVKETLEGAFESSLVSSIREVSVSRWEEDALFKGAYSMYAIGTSPTDADCLAKPIGKHVFFCGEATDIEHAGSIHGALSSGQRCAEEILESWGGLSRPPPTAQR